MRRGTVGLALAVGAAAVSAFAAGGSAARVDASATCDPGVETAPGNPPPSPSADDVVVGHRAILIGAAAPKVHEFREHSGSDWWWLKTLVIVRKGRAVMLTVPQAARRRLHLRYRGSSRSTTFRPCGGAGEWSYYPGGFVYSERGCYALDIRIEGHRAVRRHIPLGVGARCDP